MQLTQLELELAGMSPDLTGSLPIPPSRLLNSTLENFPSGFVDTSMPSPEAYYRDTYPRSESGSLDGSPAAHSFPQYPSPPDSNTSRGHRYFGVETTHPDRRRQTTRTHARRASTYMPNGLATESIEPPQFPVAQSSQNPSLHFLLARDSMRVNRFALDMRNDPQFYVSASLYESYGALWAMRDRPLHIRIVSHDLPWVIDIKADEAPEGGERGITCGDVWSKLYRELLEPIQDSDWAHLCAMTTRDTTDQRRHEYLVGVARQQVGHGESVSLVRLDWLMRKTVFIGLERDDGYRLAAQRLLPGREPCEETWIAYFSEGSSP